MLLFGSPSIDLWITIFILGISAVVSLVVLAFAKRKLLAVVIFTILGNLALLINIGSRMFRTYDIMWLKYFAVFIWPIINIFLIIYYARTSPKKK